MRACVGCVFLGTEVVGLVELWVNQLLLSLIGGGASGGWSQGRPAGGWAEESWHGGGRGEVRVSMASNEQTAPARPTNVRVAGSPPTDPDTTPLPPTHGDLTAVSAVSMQWWVAAAGWNGRTRGCIANGAPDSVTASPLLLGHLRGALRTIPKRSRCWTISSRHSNAVYMEPFYRARLVVARCGGGVKREG